LPIREYQNGAVAYQLPVAQSFYPVWAFPACIGDAVLEVSSNLRVPVELAAHAALGVVSLVCQHFVNVQCPSYDPASVSLFLMAISKSSGGKSVIQDRFQRAVVAFERTQQEENAVAMTNYRAEMKIWEDDGRQLAKEYREVKQESVRAADIRAQRLQHEKNCPVKPKKWEIRYAGVTPQGLRDALVENHAIGILSPEGDPAINGVTFSQPAILSGYWSGEDRPIGLVSGNRRPVEPRLTISVMAQEDQFALYMKSRGSGAFGTGLLGRFLVAFPQTFDLPGESTRTEDLPEPKLDLFYQRVADVLNQTLPRERLTLKLSDDAKHYWKLFKERVHDELICGNYSEDMKSFFRKSGQQAGRLAALFHYFDGATGDISPEAMKGAIAVCEWYLWECICIFTPYAPSQQQQDAEAAQKLLQWLQDATANPWRYPKLTLNRYTERDLRNYSSVRGNLQALEGAINMLHGQGDIAVQIGRKGGRVIYYPPWAAPIPVPNNYSFSWQPNSNAPLNNAFITAAQNPTFPVQPMPSHNVAGNNGNLRQSVQEASCSVDAPNLPADQEDMEFDSEQMRAVKRDLENSAMEAGIGPINGLVRYWANL
jgi:hypothetical protein